MRETQFCLPAYAALCMILLVFFVMQYSMPFPAQEGFQAQARQHAVEMQARVLDDIRGFITLNGMEAGVEAALDEDSIILRLSGGRLFTPASEQILPAGLTLLNQLKDLFLIQHTQTINIRVYTDDSPQPWGARFKNNWELSAMQAAHVLRHLLAQGIEPGRLSATGFGELEPIFPNTTEENRAKNRRVEFVLERQPGRDYRRQ
jgi:chemotaxis protein MotB